MEVDCNWCYCGRSGSRHRCHYRLEMVSQNNTFWRQNLWSNHFCGSGSNPRPGVTCGLSLLLVLVLALRVFLGVLGLSFLPRNQTFQTASWDVDIIIVIMIIIIGIIFTIIYIIVYQFFPRLGCQSIPLHFFKLSRQFSGACI